MEALKKPDAAQVKEALIKEVSQIVGKKTGIQLGEKQVSMVEGRLKRRLYELGLSHFSEYKEYFDANRETEVENLISLLTTHHTFFFREFLQFEFLEKKLPFLVEAARKRGKKSLEIYSAACSRGQEVYSLAMFLYRHLKEIAPDFSFKVFGSDVDPASVTIASNGVYKRDEIKSVPLEYLEDHWAKGKDEIADFVKVKKKLREHCEFATINLIDIKGLDGRKFDAIFCRNVFIYFTVDQIRDITNSLCKHLYPEGLFFVGVSESLHTTGLNMQAVGSSVYAMPGAIEHGSNANKVKTIQTGKSKSSTDSKVFEIPNPLRVVCVDDSSSIITLLKKILGKDTGFEVVATAANGKEAAEIVQKYNPHVITLDIHMPVATGIDFLQSQKGKHIPPVVMVTSVSRDDSSLAWKAIQLGASDYVEKPALNNLEERADEIRAKLRSAYRMKNHKVSHKLDKEFSRPDVISQPEHCLSVYVFSLSDLDRCANVAKEMLQYKTHAYFAIEGAENILPSVAERLASDLGTKVSVSFADKAQLTLGSLKAVIDSAKHWKGKISIQVFGEVSKHGANGILSLTGSQLLLEDLGGGKGTKHLEEVSTDILLSTSFSYLAQHFFAQKGK